MISRQARPRIGGELFDSISRGSHNPKMPARFVKSEIAPIARWLMAARIRACSNVMRAALAHAAAFAAISLLVFAPAAIAKQSASAAMTRERIAGNPGETGSKAQSAGEKQLEMLSSDLAEERRHHPTSTSAATRLALFMDSHAHDPLGTRAALALGYDAYSRKRFADAREWMTRASGEALLPEYVLYISARADGELSRPSAALQEWNQFLESYPQSVLLDSALESFAQLAANQNNVAVALRALEGAPDVATNPTLLYWRGRAREGAGQSRAAAEDFAAVYYRYPLSSLAHDAGARLAPLRALLGAAFPRINPEQKLARASALFANHNWRDARDAYEEAAPLLTGIPNELAELREARCRAQLGSGIAALAGLHFADPMVDAERLAAMTEFYRSAHDDAGMIASAESAASRAPVSDGAADALFTVGNLFWVKLDRDRATAFYDRAVAAAPEGASAPVAAWRAAWVEYLAGRNDASQRLADYVSRFPTSGFITDALYWAGRQAERDDQPDRARAFYQKLEQRFTQSYFGRLASRRLQRLGSGSVENVLLLDEIPPLPPAAAMDAPIPAGAEDRAKRARALVEISLDGFAEMEYHRAWTETGWPRALLDAARAAVQAEHYPQAIVLVRQLFPQIEDRKFEDVPLEVWLTGYPLPYLNALRRNATAAGVDPELFAGLVRQESAFDPEARSGSGAIGLSQLLPKTAQRIAKKLHMGFSAVRLVDPDYNLRIGSAYFAALLSMFGSPEEAIAAYNAGEDRVAAWRADRSYSDPAEFAESIPFSQTHDYVQIVMRNAAIYRRLYNDGHNISHEVQ
jgi:soluble lytic murein transglycosylase